MSVFKKDHLEIKTFFGRSNKRRFIDGALNGGHDDASIVNH